MSSRVFDDVAPPADNSVIKTTVKCGEHAFSTTFPEYAEFSALSSWLYPLLQQAEENRVFWVAEIKQAGDIRLSLNGSEVITYPGEKLSDLAQIYGFGGVLELDTACTPQPVPDFRERIRVLPRIRINKYGNSQGIDVHLRNDNDARWHAPVAWGFPTVVHRKWRVSLAGGVLHCDQGISISMLSSGIKIGDKLVLQAVLMKPEDNPQHWKHLMSLTPEKDRWECVLTCKRVGNRLGFDASVKARPLSIRNLPSQRINQHY